MYGIAIIGNTVGDGSGQVSRGDEYFYSEVFKYISNNALKYN